ncbi:MAG TPA: DNA translocase FtsK [Candidatus Vogelbacteria bacterium]|nr:DNA translocase FtsK [Candidatus Vogelbacteria bacterium]
MGRRKNNKDEEKWQTLKDGTKQAVVAICCWVIGAGFLFAWFDLAGPVGEKIKEVFSDLIGIGFVVAGLIFFLFGFSLLRGRKLTLVWPKVISSLVLFVSVLGIFSLFSPSSGGAVGSLPSGLLRNMFDFYLSFIILNALSLISLIIVIDADLHSLKNLLGKEINLFKKKELPEEEEYYEEEEEEKEPEIIEPEIPEETKKTKNKDSDDEDDEGFTFGNLANKLSGFRKGRGDFTPPPLSLLAKDSGKPSAGDIRANANIIKRTLANFGIQVEMDEISIGPSITRYALKPAEGVKLSKILGLQNDLSLALAAHPLRIEAPIPGRSLVGIEIPNKTKTTLGLANLLGEKEFVSSDKSLLVALGRGVSGKANFADLVKAPHLLIAGATGAGKSVTIHTLITSLLYRNPPEKLRLIMVDPKRVELTLYNKIPHLLTPVITEPKKAIAALRWAAKEMDRRYDILEGQAVRDIQSYHKNILEPALAKNSSGDEEIERMPYIVIIIDELADIMSSYPRELEAAVVRLAQMSRAVGIHLVISTQRPSIEVITGLIKANIPSRIALQVASQIDSRTIIDMPGAEKLLGAGDMLFLSGEMRKPIRIQSGFISEDEVKKLVKYLKTNYKESDFSSEEIDLAESEEGGEGGIFKTSLDAGDDDELYEEAREAVIMARKASASYLQRKLKVGYARAARLLDILEERGVIGPGDGAKPREVFEHPPSET